MEKPYTEQRINCSECKKSTIKILDERGQPVCGDCNGNKCCLCCRGIK